MKKLVFIALLGLILSSCGGVKTLYSWYDYENITYNYSKKQTDELKAKAIEAYGKLLNKQRGSRETVPPGLNAEYGYMLYMSGKEEEGLKFLQEEINLYPESEIYISRIIKQLKQ